jgi:hypothetical protein
VKRQEIVAFGALLLSLSFVFVDQAYDPGFETGHRGWCSANVMGVIERATAQNGFVGYTLEYVRADGSHDYSYFDRYPVFFSAGMHALLHVVPLSRGEQIHWARQAMNLLYALTLLFAVALLVEVETPPGLAVAAVALAGSGTLLVRYRDMIHFDQAALLGFTALLWAGARWYRTRSRRLLLIATAIAVLMGRGYASFAVLAVLWLVEAAFVLRGARGNVRAALKALSFGPPAQACWLAIALGSVCLGYNVWTEARLRRLPIAQVGIVDSALRRVALEARFTPSQIDKLRWPAFMETQATRFVDNLHPFAAPRVVPSGLLALVVAISVVALAIVWLIASRRRELRPPLIVAALAGVLWIFAMRGLTAFHEFTIVFALGASVLFKLALLRFVPARAQLLPALLACACLAQSTHLRNAELEQQRLGAIYTRDFRAIEAALRPGDAIEIRPEPRKLVPGVPDAVGFLLADQPIADGAPTPYLVTPQRRIRNGVNLTPNNQRVFLFKR